MKNKKFNRKELQLISIINEAKSWVSCNCELEVDKIDDGWYAGEYDPRYGFRQFDYYQYKEPLITADEVEHYNVDMVKVFDHYDVAYCG